MGNFLDWPIENPVLKKDIKQIKSKFFIVLFLGFDDIQSTIKPKLENFFSTYPDLNFIEVKDQSKITEAFNQSGIDPFAQPNMFVVDPIGNVILHYSGEVDGKNFLQI